MCHGSQTTSRADDLHVNAEPPVLTYSAGLSWSIQEFVFFLFFFFMLSNSFEKHPGF